MKCITLGGYPRLFFIMFAVDGQKPSTAVDIFNAATGNWSTASLSSPGEGLAATSLPNFGLAFFAGGFSTLCDAFYSCGCSFDTCCLFL